MKQCTNYWTIALISHASKIILKINYKDQKLRWQMKKLDSTEAEEHEVTYLSIMNS